MIENIILLRHGETEKDKTNSERKLTGLGKEQGKAAGLNIRSLYPDIATKIEIFTSDSLRTKMMAEEVSKELGIKSVREFSNMRIKNINQFAELVGEEDLLQKYLEYHKRGELPTEVQKPTDLANEFLKNIKLAKHETEVVIAVGHGVSLEAIAYSQDKFLPATNTIRELRYGEILVLTNSLSK